MKQKKTSLFYFYVESNNQIEGTSINNQIEGTCTCAALTMTKESTQTQLND